MVTGIIEIQTTGINGIRDILAKNFNGIQDTQTPPNGTLFKEKGFNPHRAHFYISFS